MEVIQPFAVVFGVFDCSVGVLLQNYSRSSCFWLKRRARMSTVPYCRCGSLSSIDPRVYHFPAPL